MFTIDSGSKVTAKKHNHSFKKSFIDSPFYKLAQLITNRILTPPSSAIASNEYLDFRGSDKRPSFLKNNHIEGRRYITPITSSTSSFKPSDNDPNFIPSQLDPNLVKPTTFYSPFSVPTNAPTPSTPTVNYSPAILIPNVPPFFRLTTPRPTSPYDSPIYSSGGYQSPGPLTGSYQGLTTPRPINPASENSTPSSYLIYPPSTPQGNEILSIGSLPLENDTNINKNSSFPPSLYSPIPMTEMNNSSEMTLNVNDTLFINPGDEEDIINQESSEKGERRNLIDNTTSTPIIYMRNTSLMIDANKEVSKINYLGATISSQLPILFIDDEIKLGMNIKDRSNELKKHFNGSIPHLEKVSKVATPFDDSSILLIGSDDDNSNSVDDFFYINDEKPSLPASFFLSGDLSGSEMGSASVEDLSSSEDEIIPMSTKFPNTEKPKPQSKESTMKSTNKDMEVSTQISEMKKFSVNGIQFFYNKSDDLSTTEDPIQFLNLFIQNLNRKTLNKNSTDDEIPLRQVSQEEFDIGNILTQPRVTEVFDVSNDASDKTMEIVPPAKTTTTRTASASDIIQRQTTAIPKVRLYPTVVTSTTTVTVLTTKSTDATTVSSSNVASIYGSSDEESDFPELSSSSPHSLSDKMKSSSKSSRFSESIIPLTFSEISTPSTSKDQLLSEKDAHLPPGVLEQIVDFIESLTTPQSKTPVEPRTTLSEIFSINSSEASSNLLKKYTESENSIPPEIFAGSESSFFIIPNYENIFDSLDYPTERIGQIDYQDQTTKSRESLEDQLVKRSKKKNISFQNFNHEDNFLPFNNGKLERRLNQKASEQNNEEITDIDAISSTLNSSSLNLPLKTTSSKESSFIGTTTIFSTHENRPWASKLVDELTTPSPTDPTYLFEKLITNNPFLGITKSIMDAANSEEMELTTAMGPDYFGDSYEYESLEFNDDPIKDSLEGNRDQNFLIDSATLANDEAIANEFFILLPNFTVTTQNNLDDSKT